jgi:hypothetical protein
MVATGQMKLMLGGCESSASDQADSAGLRSGDKSY